MRGRFAEDIAGQRFGKLVVIERTTAQHGMMRWRCRCDCGNDVVAYGNNLRRRQATSCGCVRLQALRCGKMELNSRWRGGVHTMLSGRVLLMKPDHPRAMCTGYVKRAVVVAEQKYGRPVLSTEDVHHINGDCSDDHPDNLQLLTRSEHMRLHQSQRRR